MNKQEFLQNLRNRLGALPLSEIEKSVNYYSEIIDDYIEDGISEQEAISKLEPMDVIVEKIMYDTPLPVLIKARAKPNWNALTLLLLILGFPVWFPILASVCAVLFSVYVVIWSLFIALYCVIIAFAISGIAAIVTCPMIFSVNIAGGLLSLGAGLVCIAISVMIFRPMVLASKELVKLTVFVARKIKSIFIKKEVG